MAETPIPPRTEFNPFQTFTLGPYVRTRMDAHFDPYAEGLRQPDRTRAEMESIPRVLVPAPPAAPTRASR